MGIPEYALRTFRKLHQPDNFVLALSKDSLGKRMGLHLLNPTLGKSADTVIRNSPPDVREACPGITY